jgi:hypothetical protein
MKDDHSNPEIPRLDDMPDASKELGAVQNLAASRRNTSALRTMFGVSTTEAKSVDVVSTKSNSNDQMTKRNLRAPQPST